MPISFKSPYPDQPTLWLRGNLHTHTRCSDGWAEPADTIATYERAGYDFLAITDHDRCVPLDGLRAATRMTLIEGSEVSANGPHVLAVGVSQDVPADANRQRVLDDIAAQGGLSLLNHPNWERSFEHYPHALMEALTGYTGIEIYNGVVVWQEGNALATDRWDRLLSAGRVVWGFANDDVHWESAVGCAWNMVAAADQSAEAIVDAMRRGSFYASTGVTIDTIEAAGDRLRVASADAQLIRFIGKHGRQLAAIEGSQTEYAGTGQEGGYVRIELVGAAGRMAWTQPFYC